jgi:hypothetical protein
VAAFGCCGAGMNGNRRFFSWGQREESARLVNDVVSLTSHVHVHEAVPGPYLGSHIPEFNDVCQPGFLVDSIQNPT